MTLRYPTLEAWSRVRAELLGHLAGSVFSPRGLLRANVEGRLADLYALAKANLDEPRSPFASLDSIAGALLEVRRLYTLEHRLRTLLEDLERNRSLEAAGALPRALVGLLAELDQGRPVAPVEAATRPRCLANLTDPESCECGAKHHERRK